MFDLNDFSVDELNTTIEALNEKYGDQDKRIILIGNKTDMLVEIPTISMSLWNTKPFL
jgi:hypothetical protein